MNVESVLAHRLHLLCCVATTLALAASSACGPSSTEASSAASTGATASATGTVTDGSTSQASPTSGGSSVGADASSEGTTPGESADGDETGSGGPDGTTTGTSAGTTGEPVDRPPPLACVAADLESVADLGALVGVARADETTATVVWGVEQQLHARDFDGLSWGVPLDFGVGDFFEAAFDAGPAGRSALARRVGPNIVTREFDGDGWGDDTLTPAGLGASGPAVGVGGDGRTAVSWNGSLVYDMGLLVAIADDGVWGDATELLEPWFNQYTTIAVGGDGSVVVSYFDQDTTWTRHYDGDAASWGDPVVLVDRIAIAQLAIDGSGRTLAAWAELGGVQVAGFDADADAWEPVTVVPGSPYRQVSLAVGGSDGAIVTSTSGEVPYVSWYDAARGSWRSEALEDQGLVNELVDTAAAVDSSGHAIIAWRSGDHVAFRCFDANTGTWSERVDLEGDADAPYRIDAAIADGGGAIVGFDTSQGVWAAAVD